MYYQGEVEKNDRRKIITVATAIVVVVLILVVAIIVVATRKSGGENIGGNDNASFAIEDDKDGNESEGGENTENREAEGKKEEEQPASVAETIVVSTKPATSTAETATEVPTTGPADVLPMALGLGSLTTAGTAYALSFSSRRKA